MRRLLRWASSAPATSKCLAIAFAAAAQSRPADPLVYMHAGADLAFASLFALLAALNTAPSLTPLGVLKLFYCASILRTQASKITKGQY